MKWCWISLTLLFSDTVVARDPFVPPEPSCQHEAPSLEGWRLLGMVGNKSEFSGWLYSPQGKRFRITRQAAFPAEGWRIGDIQPFYLQLNATQRCQPLAVRLQLKGSQNDKKRDTAAANDVHPRNRRQ